MSRSSSPFLSLCIRTTHRAPLPPLYAITGAVDRKQFVDPDYAPRAEAYQDAPLPIGHGQTISAPHMHAICLELLESRLVPVRGNRLC